MLKTITDFSSGSLHEVVPRKYLDAGYTVFHHQATLMPHAHEGLYELLYVQNGQGKIGYQGQTHTANEGDLVIYLPGQHHVEDWRGTQDMPMVFYCIFDGMLALPQEQVYLELFERHPVLPGGAYGAQISRLWWTLDYESRAKKANYKEISDCLVDSLVMLVKRLLADLEPDITAPEAYSIAAKARLWIHKHYAQRLTLDAIATQLHVSIYHLSHEFKRELGESPIHYLNQLRIQQAQLLLKTTLYPVQEIVFRVGFENIPNFNQLFKRHTGLTPSQYRKCYSEILADTNLKEELS